MSDTVRDEILKGLEPLFAEAERTGKWFFCNYQGLWFSPRELREHQAKGRFIWGHVNWVLRDPNEHLFDLEREKASLGDEADKFRSRMAGQP